MSRVLVIDDEPSVGQMIALIGRTKNMDVVYTTCGIEGVQLAQQQQPDVILVDLFLWGKRDGWETIEILKRDVTLQHIPVIAITAVGDLDHAYEMGCDGALLKPFTPAVLTSYINRFLDRAPVPVH